MTRDDDQLRRLFDGMRFADEPPFPPGTGSVEDDVERARRGLRKRRFMTWGSAALGSAVIVSGVAVAVPNLDLGDDGQVPVADGTGGDADDGSATADSTDETNPDPAAAEINPCPSEVPPEPPEDMPRGFGGFQNTRHCLLEIAVKHFDPEWEHLPEQSTNTQSGSGPNGNSVGTKLGWTIPGEDGLGMVQVAVTTAGYAEDEHAAFDMPGMSICRMSPDACRSETVPGTDKEVLVVEDSAEHDWSLAVLNERPDGSLVSVAVGDLFGNNSVVPVSNVDITLDQAIAFVTDPALKVDETEAAQSQEEMAREIEAQSPENADFSSTEVVPAPPIRDMSDEEAQAALDACVAGTPQWSDFEPEFGLWVTPASGEETSLVIAERGDTKMQCTPRGASLFGTPDVKGTSYLRGEVSWNSVTFGRYVSEVDRITIQFSGGPAYEAVMKNGYWYLPGHEASSGPVAHRGYGADGEVVYDSTDFDPDACYADPEGTEIIYAGADENADVADCIPMLEWDQ